MTRRIDMDRVADTVISGMSVLSGWMFRSPG
jgi:hypothetical protein